MSVERLRGRSRFAAVRARGVEGRSGGVRLSLLPSGRPSTRAAVAVVGVRGAVERNRLRRRVRAAARPLLCAMPGYDVVLQARSSRPEMSVAALADALSAALRQARSRLPA